MRVVQSNNARLSHETHALGCLACGRFRPSSPRLRPAPPGARPLAPRPDANSSKEAAKAELAKFESLVADERRMRERELNERRQALQKKQTLATELEKNERERRAALQVGAQLGAILGAQCSARNSRRALL